MIRRARVEDADAIGALGGRAWARAYGDFLPPEAYDEDAVARRTVGWRERIAGGETVLVFDLDGQIAGYAAVGPASDGGEEGPHVGQLGGLYVDPPAQGAGVGRALIDAADAALRAAGFTEAVLWVFTENEQARDLYERRGWVQEPDELSHGLQGEHWVGPAVRYRRAL